jgi:hypothetical protein
MIYLSGTYAPTDDLHVHIAAPAWEMTVMQTGAAFFDRHLIYLPHYAPLSRRSCLSEQV